MRHDTGHIGELRLEDVHFEQCGHNAMRSTNNDGVVTVKGGYFLNCDVSSLRFQGGDHPTKTSVIDGAHIVKDHSELNDTNGTEPHQGTGIHIDSRVGNAGLIIRNCDIEYKNISVAPDNAGSLWGVIRLTDTGNSNPGGLTIENTRIHNETLAPNLWFQGTNSGAKEPNEIILDGVQLTSEATKSRNIDSLVLIEGGRNGSRITNSCFHAPNGDVNAIEFQDCDGVVVEDSNANVTGEAVQLTNTDGQVRNITYDGSCAAPDFSDSGDGSKSDDTNNDSSSDDDSNNDSSSDDGSTDDGWQSFVINGFDTDTKSDYEFIVEGAARENTELSEYGTVATVETLNDGTVRIAGAIRSGVDAFDYDGSIVSYTAGSDMRFERDGKSISREEVVDGGYEHSLQIVGTGSTSAYQFAIDGTLAADPACEGTCADAIDGSGAAGEVSSDSAEFLFTGTVTEFSLDGEAGVYLDGKQVDPELLDTDADPVLGNWLTVDGINEETSYQFSVSGSLHKSPDLGPVEADDTISDGMVIGSVTDEVDGYRFSGDLSMLRVQGTADLKFNEE